MVRIRLRRVGLKGQPSYRIIAADKEAPRDGRFLEILGFLQSTHQSFHRRSQRRSCLRMDGDWCPTE